MNWPDCSGAEGLLKPCRCKDGSFSLWSEDYGQAFHSERGAIQEAQDTFLAPAGLERFAPGSTLRVLELCVGTGTNTAVLLEACQQRQLQLHKGSGDQELDCSRRSSYKMLTVGC